MTCISDETSEKIASWSFVFSLAVVVIHCAWTATSPLGRLTIALFRDTLSRMAVPFFFACSGFFLARHFDAPGWWWREVGKRMRSLAVPYVIWTFALAAVLYAESREIMGPGVLGIDPRKMPALEPLWYVRCLFVFVVLSPVFKWALDRRRCWTLGISYCAMFGLASALQAGWLTDADGVGGLLCYGFSLEGLFYFLGGMCIQRHWRGVLARGTCAGLLLLGAVLIAFRLWMIHRGVSSWVDVRCLITPVVLVGIAGYARPFALPGFLRGCAFPIFLMHGVVLMVLRRWGGTCHHCNPWLELAACVVVPIAFCNVVRRVWPRAASVLFGGRA